ncbi:MAG: PspA/IM30 family protein [Alphaproteobacteria bacterium]|nr:PspA/IM30 family protein [Alphaproteobacteria bacterium]
MALINRVSRLFKADFHAVLDQIEEPEQLLKQAIREMEDDLAETEQRIRVCAHDQEALATRKIEIDGKLAQIDEELDLCFASKKDDLAKSLIKKKLEAERLSKRLSSQHGTAEKYLTEQRAMLDENRATLEGLRQKSELFAQRAPTNGASEFDDIAWMARELQVSDDEVEVAYLREKNARSQS